MVPPVSVGAGLACVGAGVGCGLFSLGRSLERGADRRARQSLLQGLRSVGNDTLCARESKFKEDLRLDIQDLSKRLEVLEKALCVCPECGKIQNRDWAGTGSVSRLIALPGTG
jgi:hypothetical protein